MISFLFEFLFCRFGGISLTGPKVNGGPGLGGWPFGVVAALEARAGKEPAGECGDFFDGRGTVGRRPSTQKGLLEGELEFDQQSGGAGEERLKMLNGLEERIGLGTVGRGLAAAKQAAQGIDAAAQALAQVVESFQSEGQVQRMGSAFERSARQQGDEQPAQQRGGHGVAGKHLGQENGEGVAATAAPAAIGAEDALAAQGLTGGVGGIVAVKEAVPVQETDAVAALAALVFEGKSLWLRACRPATKRNRDLSMDRVAAGKKRVRRGLFDGAFAAGLASNRSRERRGGAGRHFHRTDITTSAGPTTPLPHNHGAFYDGTAARNS